MAPALPGNVIVIMGVSGAGKSTIGSLLSKTMNCAFIDADDFHPESNKEKMREGIPLSDEDRIPWLESLRNTLNEHIALGQTVVLACSALRKKYREILRSADPNYSTGNHTSLVKFVLLDVSVEILTGRINKRAAKGEHFMPSTLLQSQLDLLEIDPNEGIVHVDATQSPSDIVSCIQNLIFIDNSSLNPCN